MKNLILIVICCLFFSCVKSRKHHTKDMGAGYVSIVIDSCEYIKYNGQHALTHKGNCKFCAKRNKTEKK